MDKTFYDLQNKKLKYQKRINNIITSKRIVFGDTVVRKIV